MAISPMKEAMLRALAKYKYLTVSHIQALGISKSKDKTATYFRQLQKDYGFVGRQIHYAISRDKANPHHIKRNRQEYLWHLTVKGAKFLDSYTEIALADIRFPKRPKEYLSNDYFHRVSSVFMHLSFDRWVQQIPHTSQQVLTYYNQYHNATSKRFESETRIELQNGKHYTPDLFLSYTTPDQQSFNYVLEVYNSNGNNRIGYVEQQLERLFWILDKTKKIEQRIGIDALPRILCTFDSLPFLKGVLKRIVNNPYFQVEGIEQLLFFSLDKLVWKDFVSRWVNLEGKEVRLELK